jgi:hypothetical protein
LPVQWAMLNSCPFSTLRWEIFPELSSKPAIQSYPNQSPCLSVLYKWCMSKQGIWKYVRIMKMAVFWFVALCSLIEVFQHFRGPCSLHHHHPDDGGSKDLRNVGKLLPDYTALQPRRQPSSCSLPWEPWILYVQIILLTAELEQNGTHQRLACADYVNLLGENVNTAKREHSNSVIRQ